MVALDQTPFASARIEGGSAVVEVKRPWTVVEPEKPDQISRPVAPVRLAPNAEVRLVERHTSVIARYVPEEGILLHYTFDGRSFGGAVKEWWAVYRLK